MQSNMSRDNKVLVAMSGGVDSSVAAYLLKKKGYEVIGATMCFGLSDREGNRPSCCSESGIKDAKTVAESLGIPHYTMSFGMYLKQYVIRDFLNQYLRANTPNPCIRCNQYLKFNVLWQKAKALGCNYLATGHHARIIYDNNRKEFLLKKATDKTKDQSYFLYRIPRHMLQHVIFPVGDLVKQEIRAIARKNKISVADKPASQDICFIATRDYRHFIIDKIGSRVLNPGPIRNINGQIIGQHKGIALYTIGQRHGLGIAHSQPLYVIKLDVKNNEVIVGEKKDIFSKKFIAKQLHLLVKIKTKKLAVEAVIRYNHPQSPARLRFISNNRVEVEFRQLQPAVTPGQSVVFYDHDIVIGGAIIEKVLD